jgi:hypothetical protein
MAELKRHRDVLERVLVALTPSATLPNQMFESFVNSRLFIVL